ncbi:MAG: hypothetical protein J6N70_17525 [Oribacterium sp.]|nr:hypothetical protein [Oribacterium sp.]
MSWTKIKPEKVSSELALGLLSDSVFTQPVSAEHDRYFQQNNYEYEVHLFVEKLLNQISAIENADTETVDYFIFEDSDSFSERQLLWGCFDLLIKAELTINSLKRSRERLLREQVKQRNTE